MPRSGPARFQLDLLLSHGPPLSHPKQGGVRVAPPRGVVTQTFSPWSSACPSGLLVLRGVSETFFPGANLLPRVLCAADEAPCCVLRPSPLARFLPDLLSKILCGSCLLPFCAFRPHPLVWSRPDLLPRVLLAAVPSARPHVQVPSARAFLPRPSSQGSPGGRAPGSFCAFSLDRALSALRG